MWYSGSCQDGVEHKDSYSKNQLLFSSFHEGSIWLDGKGTKCDEFPELNKC